MANAKEYFNNKKNEMYSDEYQQRLQNHRKKILMVSVVSAVVIILFCVGIYIYNITKVYNSYIVLKEMESGNNEMAHFLQMEDKIIRYSMDGISCYDKDYKVVWNQSYEMKRPIIDVCESYVAVCDMGGTNFFVLGEDGLKGEVDTQLPIKRIAVAEQGSVAVLLEDGDVNRINYYDHFGTLLAENKAPIEKNGFPMDISLSNDGMKLAVSYMTLETGNVRTKVAFYNFDAVGANEIDHLVSAQEYDGTVVPEIAFVNATTAVAFGDSFFDIFQGSQKPVEQFRQDMENEIQSIFFSEAYIGIVLENSGNMSYLLKVYDLTGKELMSFPFNENYNDIKIKNDNVYFINGTQCMIYNFKGKLKFEWDFQENLIDVLPEEEDRMTIVLAQKIQKIKLK